MKKNKVNFLYFADEQGNKTDVAYTYGGLWDEYFDDYVIECRIVDGSLKLSCVVEDWMDDWEIKEVNKMVRHGIGDSWEFIDFNKTKDYSSDKLMLFADKESKMSKVLNSPQNKKNIKNTIDKLKDINN